MTQTPYPQWKMAHELFEQQVERTPTAVAVRYEGRSLTYTELNAKANQLAWHLRAKGVGADQLVGLCVERGLEMMIGLFGILKAGGAYVPLDPSYPPKRLQYMLMDSAPKVLLTQARLKERLPRTNCEVITLDEQWQDIARQPCSGPDAIALGLRSHHLAYVIYTSGSTGQPKGVMVEHSGLSNYLRWALHAYSTDRDEAVPVSSPLAFDATVTSLYIPLLSGRSIVLIPSGQELELLERLLLQSTLWSLVKITPAHLRLLGERLKPLSPPCTVDTFVIGGEALPPSTVELWRSIWPKTRLINEYGPTETVVGCCVYDIPEGWQSAGTVPIGRPISNMCLYILDSQRQPVAVGATGEIYIGGAGVARGYLNRSDLTAERFIKDPFSEDPQARLYRTGDLGRWREDKNMEYLGRNDSQVKINGFRIELGEIETQLLLHPQVKEAIVLAREDVSGQKRLLGYVTPRADSAATEVLNAEVLRRHLQVALPEYLMPQALIVLECLPLTENGKVDRQALPVPDVDHRTSQHYEDPRGKTEEMLAQIWRQVLKAERVGRQDSFFELGGHSLLALDLLDQIERSLGIALRVTDIYRNPALRELATRLDTGAPADEWVTLSAEATLDDDIRAGIRQPCAPAKAALLTGATGFVGRFLLAHLLERTEITVHCLVRASSQPQAMTRLKGTLREWGLWRDEFEGRVTAIPGILGVPRLGLGADTYRTLSEQVDVIYHCATSMNHLETYAMAKRTNVDAVSDLLRLATDARPKVLNYISTLSVFGADGADGGRTVSEASPIDYERHLKSQGYDASKWVAEKVVMTAGERGIPCNIFRLGLVWADAQQGRYDEQQREYKIIQSCVLSGYGIKDYRPEMPPIPVDYVARAVVSLANRNVAGGGVFHICGSGRSLESLFERCNEVGGLSLEQKPWFDWITQIKRLHEQGLSLPAAPFVEFAFPMDERSFSEHEGRKEQRRTSFDCERTQRELDLAGIVTPVLDDDSLRALLMDMFSRDPQLRSRWTSAKTP